MSEPFTDEQLAQIRTVYTEALEAYEAEFVVLMKQAMIQFIVRMSKWTVSDRDRVLLLLQFINGGPPLTTTQAAQAASAMLKLGGGY